MLVLQEFDYDKNGKALQIFQKDYLKVCQQGLEPISYKYWIVIPSNTGIPSGFDLNNDGKHEGPNDAFGYGVFPGQYAFAILSNVPLQKENMRTFQNFLWKDMPGALWPKNPKDDTFYYSEEAMEVSVFLQKIMLIYLLASIV